VDTYLVGTGTKPAPHFRWTDGNDFQPLQTWADSSWWPMS